VRRKRGRGEEKEEEEEEEEERGRTSVISNSVRWRGPLFARCATMDGAMSAENDLIPCPTGCNCTVVV